MNSSRSESVRGSWRFEYKASDLIPACQKRIRYHAERLEYWRKEARDTEEKIRSAGVQLQEFSVTGGSRFEARVDELLGRRLSEAKQKVSKHDGYLEQFQVFLREFQREVTRVYNLQLGDVIFFGLHDFRDEDQGE
jgi:hypothetical protein